MAVLECVYQVSQLKIGVMCRLGEPPYYRRGPVARMRTPRIGILLMWFGRGHLMGSYFKCSHVEFTHYDLRVYEFSVSAVPSSDAVCSTEIVT